MSGESSPLSSAPTDATHQDRIVNAETRLRSYCGEGEDDKTIAILKAFAELLPREGASNIIDDILETDTDEKLRDLARHLHTAVLTPILSRGSMPTVTTLPRFNAEQDIEGIPSEFDGGCSYNDRLKSACLKRDGQKCVVTGFYDLDEAKKLSLSERASVLTSPTQAVHILPVLLGSLVSNRSERIWDALYRCFPRIRSVLNFQSVNINDTSNAMTMWDSMRTEFGRFRFSFEPTQTVNTYHIKTYPRFCSALISNLPPSRLVTFNAHSGLDPLPSPLLLEVHATVARILHETGMGELVEKIRRERGEVHVLAANGSTDLERLLLAF